jgi:hypothetical protein
MSRNIQVYFLMLFAVLVTTPLVAQQKVSSTESKDLVWTWSKQCGGDHKLGIAVRLDGKVLYRDILPICIGGRGNENGRAEFHFAGGRTFQGRYHTHSSESIEGDIWQASGESDALILGISFQSSKQILINTLYAANPEKRTTSTFDNGVLVTTYPITAP